MNLSHLECPTKRIARLVADYEAAGLDPNMEIPQPFAANVASFYNEAALVEAGVDPVGFARQHDQVLGENLGNNFAQRVKNAKKNGLPLPDQSVMDEMVQAYDFTGVRTTSEEGMSTEERTTVAEIRKALRALISGGAFASLGADGGRTNDPEAVAFNATRVQTGPEARGEKDTPVNSVPVENFTEVVAAAYQSTTVDFEDGNGNTAQLDFGIEPAINEHGQAANLTGVIELARQEATHILERNRSKAVPTMEISIG